MHASVMGLWLSSIAVPVLAEHVPAVAVTPAIAGVVDGAQPIDVLVEGLDGSDGVLGLPDGSVLVTESGARRVLRIDAQLRQSVLLHDSNGANALALGPAGELIATQQHSPRIGIVHPPERVQTLNDYYDAKAFVRPRDLVRANSGLLYFTDSGQLATAAGSEALEPAVYVRRPEGRLRRLSDVPRSPTGIALSNDERTLYVADALGRHVHAFAVDDKGRPHERRAFAALAGWNAEDGTSGAEGLAVDDSGRVYVASHAGIEVFSADGAALGLIPLPIKAQDLAFAGTGKRWLYVVGQGIVLRLPVSGKVSGAGNV